MTDYDGKTVSLEDFNDQILIINSWASWCPFCNKELQDFLIAEQEYQGKIKVIAINRGESLEQAKRFSDQLWVSDRLTLLLDPKDSFYQAIGGFTMPETVFVGSARKILDHKRGPVDLDEIREKIDRLLKET